MSLITASEMRKTNWSKHAMNRNLYLKVFLLKSNKRLKYQLPPKYKKILNPPPPFGHSYLYKECSKTFIFIICINQDHVTSRNNNLLDPLFR